MLCDKSTELRTAFVTVKRGIYEGNYSLYYCTGCKFYLSNTCYFILQCPTRPFSSQFFCASGLLTAIISEVLFFPVVSMHSQVNAFLHEVNALPINIHATMNNTGFFIFLCFFKLCSINVLKCNKKSITCLYLAIIVFYII